MKGKKVFIALLLAAMLLLATACGSQQSGTNSGSQQSESPTGGSGSASGGYDPVFSDTDVDDSWSKDDATLITFSGKTAKVDGDGAAAVDGGVKISENGTYVLSGTLTDGRVVVDTEPGELLKLVLNGVDMTCSNSAPIYIANGDAVIVLAEGTENVLTDGYAYEYADASVKEPNACLYGDDNISINGSGNLTVNGNFNNGIGSKDELRISAGNITVNAVNNAVKGNDCVLVCGGKLRIVSKDDGIKSDNDKDVGYGIIRITGGELEIRAGDDALQAVNLIEASGGHIQAAADGKTINCDGAIIVEKGVM